jgi:hypothetical protein
MRRDETPAWSNRPQVWLLEDLAWLDLSANLLKTLPKARFRNARGNERPTLQRGMERMQRIRRGTPRGSKREKHARTHARA